MFSSSPVLLTCCRPNLPAAAAGRRSPDPRRFVCLEQLHFSAHLRQHLSMCPTSPPPAAPIPITHLLSISPALQRLLLSMHSLPDWLCLRLSGATFYTGFLLPSLPESQHFPQPSVFHLSSWFWSDCDQISCLVALFYFASTCSSLLSRHSFCFATLASARALCGLFTCSMFLLDFPASAAIYTKVMTSSSWCVGSAAIEL